MLDDFSLEALIAYAEAHPLIATLLLLVAMVLLGSLLRKIFKVAVVCAIVLLVGLYFTPRRRLRLVETDRSDRQRGCVVGRGVAGKGRRNL